ncbi:MAG: hypothetical protein WC859_01915 [Elusimicrobiota bacterium]
MNYIIENISYGYGPFLRLTEIAVALNRTLSTWNRPALGIIVPWLYGEKQREIMRQAFATPENQETSRLIFLDADLGRLLNTLLFQGGPFRDFLSGWSERTASVEAQCRKHLGGPIVLENLHGEKTAIQGPSITMELQRSPLVRFDVAPSYCVTFAHRSEILRRASIETSGTFNIPTDLLRSAQRAFDRVEDAPALHLMTHPGPFWDDSDAPKTTASHHVDIPLTAFLPEDPFPVEQQGIYVSASGIDRLDRLYPSLSQLGMAIYSNRPDVIPGSRYAPPSALRNKKIVAHLARSGWGALWSSILAGVPLIVPPYDADDDPEIFFNNRCIERLAIGRVYRPDSLAQTLQGLGSLRQNIQALSDKLTKRFGTLDGSRLAAQEIVRCHWREN